MHKRYFFILLVMVVPACTPHSDVKEDSRNNVIPQIPLGNAEEGKVLYATCTACHGSAGEGNKKMNAPALVNIDSWYLYRQLMNFKKEIRGFSQQDTLGFQMGAMAKVLKDSIAVSHVIAYIKTMPATTPPALISGDIKKGERYYQTICGSCHGPEGVGNEKMNAPRLNGLDDWYIKRQTRNFKNSVRGTHPADKLGAQMVPMMALLPNDQAVNDVIAYIRSTVQTGSK